MPQIKAINAMLVRLSISTFNNSRQDREITDEVRVRKKLGAGAGKWVKYKLPKECLEPIIQCAGDIRRWHYDHTSPWEDGSRLLNVVGLSKYQETLKEKRREFFELVDEFGQQYDNWLDQARLMHGPTFDAGDYPPDWRAMRDYFTLDAAFDPVPKAEAFAIRGVAESELQTMRTELESRVEQRIQQATQDTWNRLIAPLAHMATVLSENDPRIYESMISNITSICDLVPVLDVEGNASLQSAARAIKEQVRSINTDTLRENRAFRREVANTARQLLAQFGQVGQRKFAA